MLASRRRRLQRRWEEGLGYHVLLVALLLGLLLALLVENLGWSAVLLRGAYLLIFLEALSAAARRRIELLFGVILFLPELSNFLFFGEKSLLDLFPAIESRVVSTAFVGGSTALFHFYLVALTVRRIFQQTTITWSQVSAAASAYLLLGYAWRGIYIYLEQAEAGISFEGVTVGGEEGDFIYYSFVTLTTLGYGDITPVTMAAKFLSILEAIIGQLFLVILLARLVGMVRVRGRESTDRT